MKKIAIVGAGISGLATAHFLKKSNSDFDITLFERSERFGGNIRTEKHGDYVFEFGPRYLQNSGELSEIIQDTGIGEKVLQVKAEDRRPMVYKQGQLHPFPMSKMQIIKSDLVASPVSTFFNERKQKETDIYDSVKTFCYRHFDKEITNYIFEPYLNHIFYNDISKLSTNAVMPLLKKIEREQGSVFKGLSNLKMDFFDLFEKLHTDILSFKGGLDTLLRGIVSHNNLNILYHQQVKQIVPMSDNKLQLYVNDEQYIFDHVIMATPSFVSAHLLRDFDEEFYKAFGLVKYLPLSVINMAFDYDCIKDEGDSYFVPKVEDQSIITCDMMHRLFPENSPEGTANLSVTLGGAHKAFILDKNAHQIIRTAIQSFKEQMNVNSDPITVKIRQYSRAIPEYTMGVEKVWARIDAIKNKYDNLKFVGTFQNGVSVEDVFTMAKKIAGEVE